MIVDYELIKEQTEGKDFYVLDLEGSLPLIQEYNFGKVQDINKHTNEHTTEFFYSEGGWFYANNLIKLLNGEIIKESDNFCRICLTKEPLINLLKEYIDRYTKEVKKYYENREYRKNKDTE